MLMINFLILAFFCGIATEIAQATWDVNVLATRYQSVVDYYKLNYIDIDIEGDAAHDPASIDRRSKALAIVQKNRPGLKISYTLATTPSGLDEAGLYILKSALNAGFSLNLVNLMCVFYTIFRYC